MGNFNADCSYVTSSEWPSIRLWSDDRFNWLVDNDFDTTTTDTCCAYDRLDNRDHIAPTYVVYICTFWLYENNFERKHYSRYILITS